MALDQPKGPPTDHTQPARGRYEGLVDSLVKRAAADVEIENTRRYALSNTRTWAPKDCTATSAKQLARYEALAYYRRTRAHRHD